MPPLTPLVDREDASDEAKLIATRIPLIHVTHREGRPDFLELLLGNGVIPTSDSQYNYCGEHTRRVEELLGFPPCIYFYVGRADPQYGSVALGFGGQETDIMVIEENFHSATPFDTGGVFQQIFEGAPEAFRLNLEPDNQETRIEFCRKSLVTEQENKLSTWRRVFASWLDYYFEDSPFGYWTEKPNRSDPEELYTLNGKWNAWTWEIRLMEGTRIDEATRWACSVEFYNTFEKRLFSGGLEGEQFTQLMTFFERCETFSGDDNFCGIIEKWGQAQCQQS